MENDWLPAQTFAILFKLITNYQANYLVIGNLFKDNYQLFLHQLVASLFK